MDIKIKRGKLDSNGNFDPVGGLTYIFSGVDNLPDRHSASNTNINAPGQGSAETTSFNLSGLQRFVSFDFKIMDSAIDTSEGTNTTEVKTIDEQYKYLKNVFLSGETNIQYQLSIGDLVVINCNIDDLTINLTFNSPNKYNSSIQVSEGKNALSIS